MIFNIGDVFNLFVFDEKVELIEKMQVIVRNEVTLLYSF